MPGVDPRTGGVDAGGASLTMHLRQTVFPGIMVVKAPSKP